MNVPSGEKLSELPPTTGSDRTASSTGVRPVFATTQEMAPSLASSSFQA